MTIWSQLKKTGRLWLDQGIPPVFRRINLWMSNSTSSLDRGASNLYEYFVQGASPFVSGRGSR